MFHWARLKLTAWYLVIIMLISLGFSIAIYEVLTFELDRVERMQRLRQDDQFPRELRRRFPRSIDLEVIEEAKKRLQIQLLFINLGILGFSSLAGYFLAGRTLRPIAQMLDEQNRFITDASHELRTPLTSLKSEIEVSLRDKNLTLKDSKKLLESNLEEVNKLQYLSDNLIKLTQYQKTSELNLEAVNLAEIVKDAIGKVSKLAKNKKIKITSRLQGTTLEADKQKVTELLVIFLDNAIKYSDKNTQVSISAKKTDHTIIIEIKDQGIGIPQEEIPHLFDRFYRGDKSRTKSTPGYGLGLSIAKQIVDKHYGSIRAESQIGMGTTFFIQLPTNY